MPLSVPFRKNQMQASPIKSPRPPPPAWERPRNQPRPSCAMQSRPVTPSCKRPPHNAGVMSAAPLTLPEYAQGQVGRHSPIRLVHDLTDLEIASQAAQNVGILAAKPVLQVQPLDQVPDG